MAIVGYADQDVVSSKKILRWRFQPGTKFNVLITRSSHHDVKRDSNQINITMQSLIDAVYCVKSVDSGGTAQITLSYERVLMKTKSPNGNVHIDTAISDDNLPKNLATGVKALKEMVANFRVRFSVDNRGRILTVDTNVERFKSLEHIFPGILKGMSKKGFRKTLKQMFPVLPETPLAVGDTWNDTLESNPAGFPGLQNTLIKYRYVGPSFYKNTKFDKITTEATFEWRKPPPGVEVKIVSQESPGTIYFDSDAGRLVEFENFQRIISEYTIDGQITREKLAVTSKVEVNLVPPDASS